MTAATQPIRFMADNYAALSTSTVTGSSALSSFPVSNVVDELRYKQWMPKGNFTIDSTNNKLYFDDGSAQTATITPGDYAGPAALATEIQTQLLAESAETFTCTYNTTSYKFEIACSTAAYELTITSTSNAIWDTIGFTGVADITKGSGETATADEIRNHTSEWIKVDCAVSTKMDFVALIGPLNEAFTLSSSATVTLEGNTSDSWSSPAFSLALSVDSQGAMQFLDSESTRTYRYWRLVFEDKTNSNGPESFVFGHWYLGAYDTVTTSNIEKGFTVNQVDPSIMVQSENGAKFFNRRTNYLTFSGAQMLYVSASERRTLQQQFYDLGVHTPFYISLDPSLEVSTEYQEYTRYVYFPKEPSFQHVYKDYYSIAFDLQEAN
ncbi:MAG: hypothetical protein PVJ60_10220 [Phycisphaerales bacterium]|jgi:hypothetical protein